METKSIIAVNLTYKTSNRVRRGFRFHFLILNEVEVVTFFNDHGSIIAFQAVSKRKR